MRMLSEATVCLRAAYEYVRDTYETSKALQAHVEQYERHAQQAGRAA